MQPVNSWRRKQQEREGNYFFAGAFYATARVARGLSHDEIQAIHRDAVEFARRNNGIDYLLVYRSSFGQKLFLIDELSMEMIESKEFEETHNYCTLLFAEEY